MKKTQYDVIIVGAGPAGLSVGSELSKKLDVLVIEKKDIVSADKTWIYWSDKVRKSGLKDYTTILFNKLVARSTKGTKVSIKLGKVNKFIPGIDEKKILEHFKQKMLARDGTLLLRCSFKSLKKSGTGYLVSTSKGLFKARLVIDAMGVASPLVKKYDVIKRCYYMPVYGLQVEKIRLPNSEYDFMEPVIDRKPVPYWWSCPLNNKSDFIGNFYLTRMPISLKAARKDFSLMLKKHPYTKGKKLRVLKEYFGTIPLAVSFSQNVNGIAFVGDARGWPLGFGWGFSPIMDNYRKVSKKLARLFKKGKLSAYDLEKATEIKFSSPLKDLNARMEELVGIFLLNCTINDFDRVLKVFEPYPEILEKLCTFKLSEREIIKIMRIMHAEFSLGEIMNLFPKKDHRFLLSEFLAILKDIELETIGRIYRHFKG